MKNINKLLLLLTIPLISGACGDEFLDADILTSQTDGNYYSTPDEANDALTGCYDALQLIYDDGVALPLAADIMCDLCFAGTGTTDADNYVMIDEFDNTVAPSYLNLYESNWEYYYTGIFRCNKLINKIDDVDWTGSEELENEIEGEARFLRAYFYFDMVRLWERVPLLTEPSNENIPRSEADEIYEVIAYDLMFAAENCNDDTYAEIASTDYGHANVWAAKALLARVYLYYTGYYGKSDLLGLVTRSDVLAHLEDVIENSGYDLLDSYYDLWPAAATYKAVKDGNTINETTYAGETNKEVVFAIKYTYTSDYYGNCDGNHWLVMNGLRGETSAKYGYGTGWGACCVLTEVYENWNSSDDRRDASIIAIDEEGIDYSQSVISDVKEYTGYFTKKYIPTCDEDGNSIAVDTYGAENFMIGQFQDYFCIRFADVLLMAAELGSSNALEYTNKVHTRAGLKALTHVDKDVIFEERRLEFAFEGLRYWDLLRYDSTLEYAAEKVSFTGTVLNGNIETEKIIDGANLITTRGLCQIPNNQITLSDGVLTQNEGW